ncbi:MAG: DUF3800 domain-containing protein [Phycisphaerae bacterium]|jgi:hypothetical protein
MAIPLIAFDETGNTGQNLLDPDQPVFVLASVNLSYAETQRALEILNPKKGQEVHFASFSKSCSGKARILQFCQSDLISSDKINISVIHKGYMVVTKVVDLLIENLCYETGFDLYKNGANIGMANIFYMCIPTFCGQDNFKSFLDKFVCMIRNKDASSITEFYKSVNNLSLTCNSKLFKEMIELILATQCIIDEVITRCSVVDLDPAVPAFVNDCIAWGEQLGCEFNIVHDQSKPIEHQQEILTCLMAKDEPEIIVGYDQRKMKYPLKVHGFKLCDSNVVPQIQIADIISGTYGYVLKGRLGKKVDNNFFETIEKSKLLGLPCHPLWPSDEVTPEDLGTIGPDAGDPNLYVGNLIDRQKMKRMQKSKESRTTL